MDVLGIHIKSFNFTLNCILRWLNNHLSGKSSKSVIKHSLKNNIELIHCYIHLVLIQT